MTEMTASQTPFDIPIRRDIKWNFDDVTAQIMDDDILVNYLWLTFSLGAPGVEKFFIQALTPLIDEVEDDKLREDMSAMITQEALHSATHAKFNRAVEEAGVDVSKAYAEIDGLLSWIDENCTQQEMVGIVSAGEHMLYSFAMLYMKNEAVRNSMSPAARRLFDYHLFEEAEHGAVSHDIFRYFCGDNYWFRVKTAFLAAKSIGRLLNSQMRLLVEQSEEDITWRNWARFWVYCLGRPGVLRIMLGNLLEYLSPRYKLTFHERDMEMVRAFEKDVYSTQP